MTCEKYKNLIEKYIEGTISNEHLAELKAHTEMCKSCCEELEHCVLLQDIVKESLSSQTSTEQAGDALVTRISEDPKLRLRPARYSTVLFTGKRAAIAASVLLAVGLLLGFVMGRVVRSTGEHLSTQVPISVGKVEGIVLVRHEGAEVWQALEPGLNIHLGDTFHSAAQSACRLELTDKSTIDLNQNSMLVLKMYNGQTQFFLEHGECTASLESSHGPFFISTPHGRVEALGTEFTVKVIDE